jgi:hypothetical protein
MMTDSLVKKNSYCYLSTYPYSLSITIWLVYSETAIRGFLIAASIIFLYFSKAWVSIVDFSPILKKIRILSSGLSLAFFFNLWILLMNYLANPLIFNPSSCLVSRRTKIFLPLIASCFSILFVTNFYVIRISYLVLRLVPRTSIVSWSFIAQIYSWVNFLIAYWIFFWFGFPWSFTFNDWKLGLTSSVTYLLTSLEKLTAATLTYSSI